VFYLDIAKVDLDIAYTCTLQAYVFECFHVFLTYVCRCFIWMLYMFTMVFKCFQTFLQVFYLSFLYVTTVTSESFKNKLDITHRMRVGNGWRRGRRTRWHRPTALACEPNALAAHDLPALTVRMLALESKVRSDRIGTLLPKHCA
jgi:hypothetical protein